MKRVLCVFVLGVLAGLSGAGCGGGDSPANGPVISSPTRFGSLVFTVSTPQARYTRGAPIPVTFTVANTGTQPAEMTFGSCFDYTVRFNRGTSQIWWGPNLGCAGVIRPVSIAAGAGQTYTIAWSVTEPLNDPSFSGTNLPTPGAYTILADFTPLTLNGANLSEAQRAAFVSSPITVTVTP